MSFLTVFDEKYAGKLGKRKNTFRKIFSVLEEKRKDFYYIVETGCARTNDNFSGDGMSTVLFDMFVNYYDGKVLSIDINAQHCEFAKSLVSNKTKVVCSDSVEYLWMTEAGSGKSMDLLYLDSYDIDFNKPHESALHHMKELCAISCKLESGTLVVVDDNTSKSGKGMYVASLLDGLGYKRFINDYQIGWIVEF